MTGRIGRRPGRDPDPSRGTPGHRSLRVSKALRAVAVGCLAVLPTAACEDTLAPCACTKEFRAYLVTLVDPQGAPLADAVLTRVNLRTGRVLEPTWLGFTDAGTYAVADDGMRDEFSSDGDVVRVEGTAGPDSTAFQADFVFALPAPCFCHVEKLAGPDTITVGLGPPSS
jgi:hypothetical protein